MLNSAYETKALVREPSVAGQFLRELFRQTPLYLFAKGLKTAMAARSI